MATLWQDIRYGARMMRVNPGFTLVAVLALALGIGVNSAIFSVVNTVLLRPLPYPDPGQLMMVWVTNPLQGIDRDITSYPNFDDWRRQSKTFKYLVGYTAPAYTLTNVGEPEQLRGVNVTENFFQLFGISPARGRVFSPENHAPGKENVVVVSDLLWRRRFGADPNLVGRTVSLNGAKYTVIGIMPARFGYPDNAELWTPMAPVGPLADQMAARGGFWMSAIGRLHSGVSRAQAQTEMSTIAARLEKQFPDANRSLGIFLEPLHEQIVGEIRPALRVLMTAVGFVLLIACANVANLLLARGAGRAKEIAVRMALGAGRLRLVRQLLIESVLLAIVGGMAGILLALWGVSLLMSNSPPMLSRLGEVRVDGTVLAVTFLLSVVTGVLFGLVPALQMSRSSLNERLKEGGRSDANGLHSHRSRSILVVSEIALALVLVIAAALMIKSFVHLTRIKPGFNTERVLTMRIFLPRVRYPAPAPVKTFYQQLLKKLEVLPGVESAGASTSILLGRLPNSANLRAEGRPAPAGNAVDVPVTFDSITPGFFESMGIPLVRGRNVSDRDDQQALQVALVNESLARRFFPGEDPIGKRVTFNSAGTQSPTWITIVGIVGDTRRSGQELEPRAELYFPHSQAPSRVMTIVLRTGSGPGALANMARREVWSLDRDLPVANVRTIDQILSESVSPRRFNMALLGIFAALALVLAALGVYGVMAYSTAQRTHEIGIRMALGAQSRDVLRMVLWRGLALAAVGIGIGVIASLLLTRLMSTLLFGVSARDPLIYIFISVLLGTVALLASYFPARRATKVDPLAALRYE